MRLIDAYELKEAMEEHTDYKGYLVCDPDEIIDLAPTIEIPQWIPCSERLPEKSGRYIVTEKRFSIDDRKHNGRYQTVVEEATFSNGIWNRANFIEVVAWMPLATPYMKEGDQN